MKNSNILKIEAITNRTVIIGIDIAKEIHWAQFTDHRGLEISKPLKFNNNISGFKSLIQRIDNINFEYKFDNLIIGMEPTGHYWKTLASYLESLEFNIVLVNPYHTKRAKELDDNCQTKSDKKDALTIAKLVKDGRYSILYLPKEEYANLRILSISRLEVTKMNNSCKNKIRAITDEFFPEFETIFKTFITGKTALEILKKCPFPTDIVRIGIYGINKIIKEAVKKTIGKKKALDLFNVAKESIGNTNGLESTRIRLKILIDEYELNEKHLNIIEEEMEKELEKTSYKKILLSIPGVGIVSAASFLGEIGVPTRFSNPKQIVRLAGYNLVENSSGKHKGKTRISKRGRKNLRSLLYKMALTLVVQNKEMKYLYKFLKTRKENPLKGKQALVVIGEKIIKIMFSLMKNKKIYDSDLALGKTRETEIVA